MSRESQRKYVEDMYISIKSTDCITEYPIYMPARGSSGEGDNGRDEINCIESYEIVCGPAQPFPYIEISMKKQRVQTYYPMLLDDLKPGRNIITVDAVGKDTFILTKVKTSGRSVVITGYSPYEVLKSVYFPSAQKYEYTYSSSGGRSYTRTSEIVENPVTLMIFCLTSNLSSIAGISLEVLPSNIMISPSLLRLLSDGDEKKYMWVSPTLMGCESSDGSLPEGTFQLIFDKSLTIWQVINVCAITLGARVYFIGEKAYIIDENDQAMPQPYSLYASQYNWQINTAANEPWVVEPVQYLSMKLHKPERPTRSQKDFTGCIMDTPELGDEGVETVYNRVIVSANLYDSGASSTTGYGESIADPDMIDRSDWWCKNNPQYGEYHIYPDISGDNSLIDTGVQGSRDFYGTCAKEVVLPCTCTWSGDTKQLVEQRKNVLQNPLTHLISAKQMMHLADAEQSIGFKMVEMGKTCKTTTSGEKLEHSYWEPYYWMTLTYPIPRDSDDDTSDTYEIGPLARAKGFTDFVNETRVTNVQNYGKNKDLPGKLQLSKIVRNFPGMYSEYWFGIIEMCDLAETLSKILYKTN